MTQSRVLISPKPLTEFAPEEFHTYVKNMYKEREVAGKPKSPAPGLALTRTKKGKLSLRYTEKQRGFPFVTTPEISAMLKHYESLKPTEEELLALFREREFIIAHNRLDAERAFAEREKE